MKKLNQEYIKLLSRNQPASKNFWALNKRIKQDRKSSGVRLGIRKPDLPILLAKLLCDDVITTTDLQRFSMGLQDQVAGMIESYG
jgi:hypothetical protein